MTDLEMLKFAAKAAGIEVVCHGNDFFTAKAGISVDEWNPLTDDGDALRLAVKLGLLQSQLFIHERDVLMFTRNTPKMEATRLAIVRAAAEIGKAMP